MPFLAPIGAPGIAHQKSPVSIVIAHCEDGMPAYRLFARARHRNLAGARHLFALEAFIDGEAEDKRIARWETALELVQRRHQSAVAHGLVLGGRLKSLDRRLLGEFGDIVWPNLLSAHALMGNALDAVANLRAGIDADGALDHSLIVVDEKTRGDEVGRELLFLAVELDGARNRVSGAAAELPLVIRVSFEMRPQIDRPRQRPEDRRRRGIEMVARIRQVGDPAEFSYLIWHCQPPLRTPLVPRRARAVLDYA